MLAESCIAGSAGLAWPASPALCAIARRVCWWQAPAETLAYPALFMAQLMTVGTWHDVCTARAQLGDQWFRQTLAQAPPGVFDAASWHYWHHVFGLAPVPPLPTRRFP